MTSPNPKPLFSIHLYRFVFSPRLIPTLAVLCLLPLLLSLGVWQLHRADYKRTLLKAYALNQAKTTIPLSRFLKLSVHQQKDFTPINASGHYDNQHIFLIENQFHQHHVGYQVIVPFKPDHSAQWLLVNQGWIPQDLNRKPLIKIIAITKKVNIKGYAKRPSGKNFVLQEINTDTWPRPLPHIAIKKMAGALRKPMLPFVLLLAPDNNHGYIRDWKPAFMPPARHMSYAIQWFALALTLVIIYFVLNTRTRQPYHVGKKQDDT